MRAFQVFASMSPQAAVRFFDALAEKAPLAYTQALSVAAAALKARPVFLARQPAEKRAEHARRTLARVKANAMAEELLATYFLDCRKELLVEWLDCVGLEHEEGVLKSDSPPEPRPEQLKQALESFRSGTDGEDREFLLRAFVAQAAIEWPGLEALLEG